MACCPFHNEKTPSFTVTPSKGIYKCFGCGKAGDAIRFVMDIEGISYPETLKYLAKKYGIEINEEAPSEEEIQENTLRESLYIILGFAERFYQQNLWESEEGKSIGLSYFLERGFNNETVRTFSLGYSFDAWDALTRQALKEGYQKDFLLKAGLSIEGDEKAAHKLFDRFRGRVIFPIHNLTGKVIGFGARTLKKDKKQPKYLNSPESEIYHKSKVLYGLYQAKNAVRQEDNCFLVEGYTDVISLHQEGIHNVVASSGTSLTEEQIKLIKRYSDNITVLYDGDSAGLKASLRGIDMILAEDMNVKVVVFPEGEDPDSYIKKVGGDEFVKYVKTVSKDFISFKTEIALKDAGEDVLKKAEVIREIVESISKVPDSIKRAVFFQQSSRLLEMDEQILIAEFNKIRLRENKQQIKEKEAPLKEFEEVLRQEFQKPEFKPSDTELREREILRLLLLYGNESLETSTFASYVLAEIEDTKFSNPLFYKILFLIRESIAEFGIIVDQKFFQHEDEKVRSLAIELVTNKFEPSPNWIKHEIYIPKDQEILSQIGFSEMLRFKQKALKLMIKENLGEIQKAESEGKDINTFMQIHLQLKETEKELARLLGNVIS